MLLVAAVSRLLPHPPNFAPIAAMSLFGAAYFKNSWSAFLFPMLAMFMSDIALEVVTGYGFHSGMWSVYLSFGAVALLGRFTLRSITLGRVAGSTAAGTLLFFLLTNFAVWASGLMYPLTAEGLVACYIAALPFLGYSAAGNVLYVALLFGGFELAKRQIPALSTASR